ncbi:MAG TPA: imidazole glycerol phosphate synthase subunit HisH [Nitrososphaerales archaeon]|nr:imidazole glycerol phosphate synthase subunit HisH [Nitrososphaerales archaeon]HUK74510.1 imidazole glycerol phosphate synthase subunit HisH [Nitrososphaerales archaeon]
MKMQVFNYGAGNLFSIQAALRKEGVRTSLTKDGKGMGEADAIVLPGVGSFNQAAKMLPMAKIRDAVRSGKPLLGVCLGLQLFFAKSEEGPGRGLGLFPGEVRKLPSRMKIPQIGWNTVRVRGGSELVEGLGEEPWVYYVNSFYPAAKGRWVVATTEYGVEFPAVVSEKNVHGTQFHPEKSGAAGRKILRNFLQTVKR